MGRGRALTVLVVSVFFTANLAGEKTQVLLKNILEAAVEIIYFIQSWPLSTHLLNILCDHLENF